MERHKVASMDNPWEIMDGGVSVRPRTNPLKMFVRGVETTGGGPIRVSSWRAVEPASPELQNTAVPLFPAIDLIAFVGIIMSLMAVVFGYDAICGEKQRGTLRLMLSYSVPRHTVLIAKWIGGYVTLITPLLLTVLAGAAIVGAQRDIALDAGRWARLAAILGFAVLYVAAMYSLAIYVSCLTANPATSVLILLSVWVVVVLAIPNLSPHVAGILRPAADPLEIAQARDQVQRSIWDRDEGVMQEKQEEYEKQHGIPHRWWETDPSFRNKPENQEKLRAWREFMEELDHECTLIILDGYRKVAERYGRQVDAQTDLSRWIGRVSPFSCFALAATELADVGIMEGKRYLEQAYAFQRTLCDYGFNEIRAHREYERKHKKPPPPWNKSKQKPVPEFHYVPAPPREYVRAATVDGGILLGGVFVLFMLSFVTFLRYDVR